MGCGRPGWHPWRQRRSEATPELGVAPVTVNVRLRMYGGIFTDADFAIFAWRMVRGHLGDVPGADRSAACTLELAVAEAL